MPSLGSFNLLEAEESSVSKRNRNIKIAGYVIAVIALLSVTVLGGFFLGRAGIATGGTVLEINDAALQELSMSHADLEFAFAKFLGEYGKSYQDAYDYNQRKEIFKQNLLYIQRENAKGQSYTLGETQFLDMTNDEFKALNKLPDLPDFPITTYFEEVLDAGTLPDEVDFRDKGVVTPIKNQGACGSCWAFSTTGAVESANALVGNGLVSLSEQQLVDCCKKNHGCGGGFMDPSFQYTIDDGLTTEASYPYKARNGKCHKNFTVAVRSESFQMIGKKNTSLLLAAAATQPVSVVIQANRKPFQFYKSGVLDDSTCGIQTDHAVLVVGYGTTLTGQEYYIVKNSWGPKWGESGYLRIARGPDKTGFGVCGILTLPIIPTVKANAEL